MLNMIFFYKRLIPLFGIIVLITACTTTQPEYQIDYEPEPKSSFSLPASQRIPFPHDAAPDRCYAPALVPAKYESYNDTIVIKEATEGVKQIYETRTVMEYVEETNTKTVRPQYTPTPNSYQQEPRHLVWKKGHPRQFKYVHSTTRNASGEYFCLVDQREIDVTYNKQKPISAEQVIIDKIYTPKPVKKRVLKDEIRYTIPAVTKTVTKRRKIADAYLKWEQVICQKNLTHRNVRKIQEALRKKQHYYHGQVHGIIDTSTLNAVNHYAKDHGIPQTEGKIPVAVLKKLLSHSNNRLYSQI